MSSFIQGLLPRIRYTMAEQMKNFVEQERGSILTARRVRAAEGRSVRTRLGDPGGRLRPIWSRDSMTAGGIRRSSQPLVPTMYAGPGMRRGFLEDCNACHPLEEVLQETRYEHQRPGHWNHSTL